MLTLGIWFVCFWIYFYRSGNHETASTHKYA